MARNPATHAEIMVRLTRYAGPEALVDSLASVDLGRNLRSLSAPPVGRNKPCSCGSGKKYKHCCGRRR